MFKPLAIFALLLALANALPPGLDSDEDGASREKRAILQTVSYATAMNLIKNAQPCCTEPSLLPNTMNARCTHVYNKQRLRITTRVSGSSRNFGFFNMLQSFQSPYDVRERDSTKPKIIERNYDEFSQHVVEVSNTTNLAQLKMDRIVEFYKNVTDTFPEWEEVINNGTAYCEKNAFAKPRAARASNGRLCSTLPLRFSLCMRKFMVENCLADNSTTSTTCSSALNALKSTQPGFTVQVPKEKQSFDTIAVVIG